jgi:prophage tail gpP-like protein
MGTKPKYTVKIGEVELTRIGSLSLRLGMTELADSFSVSCADRLPLGQEGQRVEITVEGRIVLVGEVMTEDLDKAPNKREISFTGYSAAQRLVKSSYIGKRRLKELSLKQIVERVVEDFDLVVDVDSTAQEIANQPIPKVSADNGTTAFAFIAEVAKRQGCILVSGAASVSDTEPAKSAVRITRAAVKRAPFVLVYPHPRVQNIHYSNDIRDVYSDYIVNRRGGGTLSSDGSLNALEGLAFDDLPYSPIIIQAEQGGNTQEELDRQAEWEMRKRSAEGKRVSMTYDGWSPNNSQALWWPNLVWQLVDTDEGVNGLFVLASVELSEGPGGATAILELLPPDAYAVLHEPRKQRKKPHAKDPAKGFIKAGELFGSSVVAGLQAVAGFTVDSLTHTTKALDVDLSKVSSVIAKPEDPDA